MTPSSPLQSTLASGIMLSAILHACVARAAPAAATTEFVVTRTSSGAWPRQHAVSAAQRRSSRGDSHRRSSTFELALSSSVTDVDDGKDGGSEAGDEGAASIPTDASLDTATSAPVAAAIPCGAYVMGEEGGAHQAGAGDTVAHGGDSSTSVGGASKDSASSNGEPSEAQAAMAAPSSPEATLRDIDVDFSNDDNGDIPQRENARRRLPAPPTPRGPSERFTTLTQLLPLLETALEVVNGDSPTEGQLMQHIGASPAISGIQRAVPTCRALDRRVNALTSCLVVFELQTAPTVSVADLHDKLASMEGVPSTASPRGAVLEYMYVPCPYAMCNRVVGVLNHASVHSDALWLLLGPVATPSEVEGVVFRELHGSELLAGLIAHRLSLDVEACIETLRSLGDLDDKSTVDVAMADCDVYATFVRDNDVLSLCSANTLIRTTALICAGALLGQLRALLGTTTLVAVVGPRQSGMLRQDSGQVVILMDVLLLHVAWSQANLPLFPRHGAATGTLLIIVQFSTLFRRTFVHGPVDFMALDTTTRLGSLTLQAKIATRQAPATPALCESCGCATSACLGVCLAAFAADSPRPGMQIVCYLCYGLVVPRKQSYSM